MHPVVFSSATEEWATPRAFVRAIERRLGGPFDLDVCATPENTVCERFYTKGDDGLSKPWNAERVWMNPPYGYGIGKWIRKAWESSERDAGIVVALIPAKTETAWWHDYVMRAVEICLIRGRMRFSGSLVNAPFPSALVMWEPVRGWDPTFTTMNRILDSEPLFANLSTA